MSVEDKKALKAMKDSVVIVSGHYQHHVSPTIGLQLKLLRKRFLRDEEFFQRYKCVITEYIPKVYARQVPVDQLNPTDKPFWYLPHHAVFHPHKRVKLRVVFDCT